MARLPTVGGDEDEWGAVLNDFLLQSHTSSGSVKDGVVNTSNINTNNSPSSNGILLYDGSSLTWSSALGDKADDADVVHNTGAEAIAGVKTFSSSPIVPDPTSTGQAASKDYVDTFVPIISVKTADQISSSSTLADITEIGLSVDVGTYEFDFLVPWDASVDGASGIEFGITGPTTSLVSYRLTIQSTFTTHRSRYFGAFSGSFSVTDVGGSPPYLIWVKGITTTTASGTIQPQFAISVGATTTTVFAGSFGKLMKIS